MTDMRNAPATAPGRPLQALPLPGGKVIHTLADGSVNQAVLDRLRELHDRGWLARAEIEAALGLDPPPGRWECPGQFGADGTWTRCCGRAA